MSRPRVDAAGDAPLLDVAALQRRVLLTAVLTMTLFVAAGVVMSRVGAPGWVTVPVVVLLVVGVVRPMMRPVRAAVRLRRDLAYQAFLEQRRAEGQA